MDRKIELPVNPAEVRHLDLALDVELEYVERALRITRYRNTEILKNCGKFAHCGSVAQRLEQSPHKAKVVGSNPTGPTQAIDRHR